MDKFVIFVILLAVLYVIWYVAFVACLERIKHEFDRKATKRLSRKERIMLEQHDDRKK